MYKIDTPETTQEFREAWNFAGHELGKQGGKDIKWLKSEFYPPFLDHFSFALGNQVFSILIDIVNSDGTHSLTNREGVRQVEFCENQNVTPAVFRIAKKQSGELSKVNEAWNLQDTRTDSVIIPDEMVSDERIPMSEWERDDFGIQAVRGELAKEGKKVFAYHSIPKIFPQIWFLDNGKRNFIIVKTSVYPELEPKKPENILDMKKWIMEQHAADGGYFAAVGVINAENDEPPMRGCGMYVVYKGLESI